MRANKDALQGSVMDMRRAMDAESVTSEQLAKAAIQRVAAMDRTGLNLCAVIEMNPAAVRIAQQRDADRRTRASDSSSSALPMLHGVPIMVKDNIDTDDEMHTTAGSLAMFGSRPVGDAVAVRHLRNAGAVIVGKTNLSEWANFRSTGAVNGWSGAGGLTLNPASKDRSAGGSSSGSAAAVAAGYVPAAVGTETDGSIVCPASLCGVVGIKPSLGRVSTAGVVPITPAQDTVGALGRTVTDAAVLVDAMCGEYLPGHELEAATGKSVNGVDMDTNASTSTVPPVMSARGGLTAGCCTSAESALCALRGVRVGVLHIGAPYWEAQGQTEAGQICINALRRLEALVARGGSGGGGSGGGAAAARATFVWDVQLPGRELLRYGGMGELDVMLHEFAQALPEYLARRRPPTTLEAIVAFNQANASREMALFSQDLLEEALRIARRRDDNGTAASVLRARSKLRAIARCAIDSALRTRGVDVLVCPTCPVAWSALAKGGGSAIAGFFDSYGLSAVAGYPVVSLPVGKTQAEGLPVGLSFLGTLHSDALLVRIASAMEKLCVATTPSPNL